MSDLQGSIFISYARTDSDFVDRLEADLRAREFQTWVDRQKLEGGQDWADMIQGAIDRCDMMLVVLSPDSVASEWVKREIGYAQDSGKTIIPVGLRQVTKVPIRLEGIQWVQFEASYQRGLESLLFSLATPVHVLPRRPTVQPVPITAPQESTDSDLVIVRPSPPPPDPDLDALWRSATVARTAGNLDLAEVYLLQLVQHQEDFGYGLAKQQLGDISARLSPIRIQSLRSQARNASASGDWRQAIGAWRALLDDRPDDSEAQQGLRGALRERAGKAQREGVWGEEIGAWEALLRLEPEDIQSKEHIPFAEQNQKWMWLYANAQRFKAEGQLEPARDALETLWSPERL